MGRRKLYIYAYVYINMAKVISLSNEAYNELKRLKGKRSFSSLVLKLLRSRGKKLSEIVRGWESSAELADEIERAYLNRGKFRLRDTNDLS